MLLALGTPPPRSGVPELKLLPCPNTTSAVVSPGATGFAKIPAALAFAEKLTSIVPPGRIETEPPYAVQVSVPLLMPQLTVPVTFDDTGVGVPYRMFVLGITSVRIV